METSVRGKCLKMILLKYMSMTTPFLPLQDIKPIRYGHPLIWEK